MNKKEMFVKKYFSGKHKKAVAIVLGVVVIMVFAIVIWGTKQSKAPSPAIEAALQESGQYQPDIVYYYGQECTHCKNIDKFILDNKIGSRISFNQKEVWHEPINDMEMRERAKGCDLDPEKVGVPFLWAKGKCYMGEVEVEKFLKSEVDSKK